MCFLTNYVVTVNDRQLRALTDGIRDPDPLIFPARFGTVTGQNQQVRVSFTAVPVRPRADTGSLSDPDESFL